MTIHTRRGEVLYTKSPETLALISRRGLWQRRPAHQARVALTVPVSPGSPGNPGRLPTFCRGSKERKPNVGQSVHHSRRPFRSEWETRTCHWRHPWHWHDDSARPSEGGRPRRYQLTQGRHVRGGTAPTVRIRRRA